MNQKPKVNGIDYVEVFTSDKAHEQDSCLILVVCFKEILDGQSSPLLEVDSTQIEITGGTRIKTLKIRWVKRADSAISQAEASADLLDASELEYLKNLKRPSFCLAIRSTRGDFSQYAIHLLPIPNSPLENFDPILSQDQFYFRIDCQSHLDCKTETRVPVKLYKDLDIDYMARDYASFRHLLLDRLSLIIPDWKERNPAEFGIAMVELMAYIGDHLSYYQDGVATEAYLSTARRRVSVKRHARLLDYFVHEGCNSRAWIHFKVAKGQTEATYVPAKTKLLTSGKIGPVVVKPEEFKDALREEVGQVEVFETVESGIIFAANNELNFYQFGNVECCLAPGTTSATLSNEGNRMFFELFAWDDLQTLDSIDEPNLPRNFLDFLQGRADISGTGKIQITRSSNGKIISMETSKGQELVFTQEGERQPGNDDDEIFTLKINDSKRFSLYIKEISNRRSLCALKLQAGDTILFEEVYSPSEFKELVSGKKEHSRRIGRPTKKKHFVRLTDVKTGIDKLTETPLVNIQWDSNDALPFSLCLMQSRSEDKIIRSSIARGNILLADHGNTIKNQFIQDSISGFLNLGPVGSEDLFNEQEPDEIDIDKNSPAKVIASQYLGKVPFGTTFRPKLTEGPLTFATPYDPSAPASSMLLSDPKSATAAVRLYGEGQEWHAVQNLLYSNRFAPEFVVEIENDRSSYLRFGNQETLAGRVPTASTENPERPNHFFASYRIGNGKKGNVGAGAINRIVWKGDEIEKVYNPEQAIGGQEPEDLEEVKLYAPYAFLKQERAITEDDYSMILKRHPEVQRAKATIRWTGSWYTVFVAIDRSGGREVDNVFKSEIVRYLETYRVTGYDLEILEPAYVPLNIMIRVRIKSGYSGTDILHALKEVFGKEELPDVRLGFFHPDNFTFGTPVFASRIYERASEIEGVESVYVETFERKDRPEIKEFEEGVIKISEFEIARLDNDPNHPDRGLLEFKLEGEI